MLRLPCHTFPNGYSVSQSYELTDIGIGVILAHNPNAVQPYVTAKVTEASLRGNEWYSGHYFSEESEARSSYTSRIAEMVEYTSRNGHSSRGCCLHSRTP